MESSISCFTDLGDSPLDGLALFVLDYGIAHMNEITVKGHWLIRLKDVCGRRVFRQDG